MNDDDRQRPRLPTTYGIRDDGRESTPVEVPPRRRRNRSVDDDTNELPVLPQSPGVTVVADEGVIKDLADELAARIFRQRWWWGVILGAVFAALVVGGGAYIWYLAERIDRLESLHK